MKSSLLPRSIVVGCMIALVGMAHADTVGPPIAVGPGACTSGKLLTQTQNTWASDFSTYDKWKQDVHFVLGYLGGTGSADIQYSDSAAWGLSAGNVMVGRGANGNKGMFVYKFALEDGYTTGAGGKVLINAAFHGIPSSTNTKSHWLGICDKFEYSSYMMLIDNRDSYDKKDFYDASNSTFGLYHKEITLDIPVGVSEFYVAVVDQGTGARLAIDSVNVNSVIVPEPATLSLLGLGGTLGLFRAKK